MSRPGRGWLSLWPFAILWAGFCWPFLLTRKAFTLSDFSVQHLPWAWETFQAVREGRLPFWTDRMGCGFPLLAEGQAAALYLPQWLSYRFLPFWQAYAWSVPFHLAVGALGTYLYARRLEIGSRGAALAATVFAFGSAYAGCFYNAGSLRTLCWLPVVLWLTESARRRPLRETASRMLLVALVVSQQWTAGFAQMAAYSIGYLLLHEAVSCWKEPGASRLAETARRLAWMGAAVGIGSVLALPQILPTLELIGQSVRSSESASFALWGSVPPAAPISLAFPEWGNALRLSFYIGIFPLLLCVVAAGSPRSKAAARHLLLAAIFFVLALGRFNPLYAWAVEVFSLTFFRNPAKFLFFVSFSLALTAGAGYERLERVIRGQETASRRQRVAAWAVPVIILAAPAAAQALAKAAAGVWPAYSRWYVTRLVAEKGAAAKSFEHYEQMMNVFFSDLGRLLDYANPLNLQAIALTLASAGIVGLALARHETLRRLWVTGAAVLVWDLWVFGWLLGTGFIGNAGPVPPPRTDARGEAFAAQALSSPGRIAECILDPANERFAPNSALLTDGLSHAGAYTPLLLGRYQELFGELGFVDGSLGRAPASVETWASRRHLLDAAGIRHIHSDARMKWKDLLPLKEAPGFYLYENPGARPGLSVFYDWEIVPDAAGRLARLKGEWPDGDRRVVLADPQIIAGMEAASSSRVDARLLHRFESGARLEYEVTSVRPGIAVASTMAYPGWTVLVDGRPVPWFAADHAFLGFQLPEGTHRVRLEYRPTGWDDLVRRMRWVWGLWLAALVSCAVPLRRRA